MRALLVLIIVCFSATAFAQSPLSKAAKLQAQSRSQTPMGCKLVGTVRGTKVWAGDCTDAAGPRGAAPTAETASPSLPEQRLAQFQPVKSNNFPSAFGLVELRLKARGNEQL